MTSPTTRAPGVTPPALHTTYAPGRPIPLRAIIGELRHGGGDPTWREADGGVWRACQTPEGPVAMLLRHRGGEHADEVQVSAYGPGAGWAIEAVPALLGEHDDPSGFRVHHAVLREPARRQQHWRNGRTGLVIDSLIPAIIEQRVIGRQAFAAYRTLLWRFGAPAPAGPENLRVPPSVVGWQRIPSWEWLRAGVDAARSDAIMRALAVATRLEECAGLPFADARRRLRSIPGIGVWTAAETAQRALGDPDAVSFGDYHVPRDIGWALTGAPVDDAGLAKLLQPYAGHGFRVQHLVTSAGLGRPRRGARLSLPTHLPARF